MDNDTTTPHDTTPHDAAQHDESEPRRQVPDLMVQAWNTATGEGDPLLALGATRALRAHLSTWESQLVKEAMAHAMDRQRMVKSAYPGSAPGASVVPPANGDWVNPALHPETFDLALANKLLDKAGYKKGPNGIRIASPGVSVRL